MRLSRASRIGLLPNNARSRALPPAFAARPRRFLDSWRGLLRRLRRGCASAGSGVAPELGAASRAAAIEASGFDCGAHRRSAPGVVSRAETGSTGRSDICPVAAVRTRRSGSAGAEVADASVSRLVRLAHAVVVRRAERTGFARPANVSIDDVRSSSPRGPLLSNASASPLGAWRSPPISATTANPSSVGCGASCGGFSPNDRSPPRRRRRRRRRRPTSPSSAGRASPRSLACETSSPSWPGASRISSSSSSSGAGSSTIVMRSSAGARGGSLSILTPVAGSPRSIAW